MQKTIHFRQVEWLPPVENLPQLLFEMLEGRPNIADTVFMRESETGEVRHRAGGPHEMRLHVVTHVAGATKGIRSNQTNVPFADVGEAGPPEGNEFTEREIALVVRGNSLAYVATGHTLANTVADVLRSLLQIGYGVERASRLVLSARADPAMIQQLLDFGVDRLDFDLVLPSADADILVQGQPLGLAAAVAGGLATVFSEYLHLDHGGAHIDALVAMNSRLHLDIGRSPTLEQVESLTAIARGAVAGGEEFKIRTADGKTEFTREKLTLKSTFYHAGSGATLPYEVAWVKSAEFLNSIA